ARAAAATTRSTSTSPSRAGSPATSRPNCSPRSWSTPVPTGGAAPRPNPVRAVPTGSPCDGTGGSSAPAPPHGLVGLLRPEHDLVPGRHRGTAAASLAAGLPGGVGGGCGRGRLGAGRALGGDRAPLRRRSGGRRGGVRVHGGGRAGVGAVVEVGRGEVANRGLGGVRPFRGDGGPGPARARRGGSLGNLGGLGAEGRVPNGAARCEGGGGRAVGRRRGRGGGRGGGGGRAR